MKVSLKRWLAKPIRTGDKAAPTLLEARVSNPRTISIAGAGLAGALLAVLLSQRGHRVRLYERRSDMRRQEIAAGRSINLALAARGIRALHAAGMHAAVAEDAIAMPGRMVHARDGSSEFFPYDVDGKRAIYSVHRARLNQRLLDAAQAAGAEILFEHRVLDVALSERQLTVERGDGTREQHAYSLLIGADGAGSAVRNVLDHAHGCASSFAPLAHSYKELSMPAGADGGFVMAQHALHIWPRLSHMMIALPNPDRSFTCTLFLPNEGATSFATLDSEDAVASLFGRDFDDAIDTLPGYTREFMNNPTGWLGTLDCPHWRWQDQVILLGDAAHAIVPFHGQGMNCAFEDCIELCDKLDQELDLEAALAGFESARRPNAKAIAEMAIENYREMRDEVADPGFKQRKQWEKALAHAFPGHFLPRYSLVSFTQMPYAEAQQRGVVQRQLIDALISESYPVDFVQPLRSRVEGSLQVLPAGLL